MYGCDGHFDATSLHGALITMRLAVGQKYPQGESNTWDIITKGEFTLQVSALPGVSCLEHAVEIYCQSSLLIVGSRHLVNIIYVSSPSKLFVQISCMAFKIEKKCTYSKSMHKEILPSAVLIGFFSHVYIFWSSWSAMPILLHSFIWLQNKWDWCSCVVQFSTWSYHWWLDHCRINL